MASTNSNYLAFTVGDYRIALETGFLERVLPAASVQPAPNDIPSLMGFLVVEGEVFPLLSCHVLLRLPMRTIVPEDHFLMITHHTHQPAGIRLMLHVEKLLGLITPGTCEPTLQHIPVGNDHIDLNIIKSQWGLLTLLRLEELLAGVDIELIMNLIDQHPTA